MALERLTYDRTAKAVTYRSDKSEGPTAGTETADPLEIDTKTYEILFFSPTGKHVFVGVQKDTIPWKDLTPIAMIDKKVVGKGWDFLDSLYAAHKIPVKKR